ncbi:NADP-dependent oxidoreductase [Terriglobus tenax]|uniref:NADP-dependent oxidoreductase n=1 Tax=Terriglobus tenax TaxID=1111115 RepID=UPI0021DFF881|nr:NADP-dependent oxidoreductase [Terriglobus tenax]
MKCIRFHQFGGPEVLKFEEVQDPVPQAGEVLVRMTATSLNPIDMKLRSGAMQAFMPVTLPMIPGNDVSGVVAGIGPGVNHFELGQKVIGRSISTYAELVLVKASELTHLPDGVDPLTAAALPVVVTTGDQLIRACVASAQPTRILIAGALGSVGRAAVHAARKTTGVYVIAAVRSKQLDEARLLLASEVIALDDTAAMAALPAVDAVADTIGGKAAAALLPKVKPGGIFATITGLPASAAEFPQVQAKMIGSHADPSKVREFADDLRDGKFHLPIRAKFPLAQAAEAHTMAESGGGSAGKILLFV